MTWLAVLFIAHAQSVTSDRPVVPSAGVAAEGGPGMFWVNPALTAYDQDPRYGVFVGQQVEDTDTPTSVGGAVGIDGLSVGVHALRAPDGSTDWSLDYSSSIRFPKRVAGGFSISWDLIEGGQNFVAYDAGVAWRPLPWLGVGGAARNIGSPDPRGISTAESSAGIALRPFDRAVVLGVDYTHRFDDVGRELVSANLRVRPTEGFYLRGSATQEITASGIELFQVGGGIEVYFDGMGVGAHLASDTVSSGVNTWFGSDEPGESLVRSGRRVALLQLDEVPPYQPRTGLFGIRVTEQSWLDTLQLIRRLETERGEVGLVLTLGESSVSWARYRELRERVRGLEEKGRPVVVYLTGSPTNGDYYVASAASRVLIHPAADLGLAGLAVELVHMRGALDLIGIEPQFVKRADYKSAPETWTKLEPTESNLEQQNALLDDLFAELVSAIASGREQDEDTVRDWVDAGPWTANEAVEAGLVDATAYPNELERVLQRLHTGSVRIHDLADLPQGHSGWEQPSQIAVIYVEGPIVSGESSGGGLFGVAARSSGSKTLSRQLAKARENPLVRAVVLRVDSPGGSAFASDEILNAITRVQSKGKPVVVSMGGVAASGGYYVAASADSIWAEPNTLTGSIGVFSGKFNLGPLFDTVGLHTTSLTRGRAANLFTPSRGWDDVERERMEHLVDDTYRQFKEKVAEGRELSMESVETVARGRVWSGSKAQQVGLVDHLGGLPQAIDDARERAGIPATRKVALVTYSPTGTALESLSPTLTSRMVTRLFPERPKVRLVLPAELQPLWFVARHPDESVWMMDPYTLDVSN